MSFQLLRPVETPTVALEYRGSRHDVTLYPRVATTEVPFRVSVSQPSLAVVFGDEARFQLTFEPLQPQSLTLDLAVQNLPAVCTTSFRERQSGAAVSSLRLGAGSGPKEVELVVKLPPGPVPEVRLDVALVFAVVARFTVDGRQGEAIQDLRITPVGVPKLELRTASWLVEMAAGEEVTVPLDAANEGTAPAHDVGLRVEAPGELTVRAEPPQVGTVAVGEKTTFALSVRAARGAMAGEYTLRLQPRIANRPMAPGEAEGQLRVRVHSSKAWLWPVALSLLLLGVGTVVFRSLRKLRLD